MTGMDYKNIILNEIIQMQKLTYCMISFYVKCTEKANLQTQNRQVFTQGFVWQWGTHSKSQWFAAQAETSVYKTKALSMPSHPDTDDEWMTKKE